jgi:hypothetical protein
VKSSFAVSRNADLVSETELVEESGVLGAVVVGGGCGVSFQWVTLALTPRRNSWRLKRRVWRWEPVGSSNATTREEWSPVSYDWGLRT